MAEFGFRVDTVLPRRTEMTRPPVWPVRWLLGVAVGPVMDNSLAALAAAAAADAAGGIGDGDSDGSGGVVGSTATGRRDHRRRGRDSTGGGGPVAARPRPRPRTGPRPHRLMLHFSDHRVLTYELSRDEETQQLIVI